MNIYGSGGKITVYDGEGIEVWMARENSFERERERERERPCLMTINQMIAIFIIQI